MSPFVCPELQGFRSEIQPRLKDWQTFEAANYEMLMAKECLSLGAVELVVRGSEKTPDLKVSRDGQSVVVECQRKERLTPTPITDTALARLSEANKSLLAHCRSDVDILVSLIGTDPTIIAEVLSDASQIVASGFVGTASSKRHDAVVWISEAVTSPLIAPQGATSASLFMAAGLTCGVASMQVRINEHGIIETRNAKRLQVMALDSHRFSSVLAGFNTKRKQNALDDVGVLSFDLDLSNLHPNNASIYLGITAQMLVNRAWRGGENTRVGGIIFTAYPFFQVLENDGLQFMTHRLHWLFLKRNDGRLPEWFAWGEAIA
jgi:hypothetical protein